MSAYPPRDETIPILLEVAHKAALRSTGDHPEDIASAMSAAMEYAAVTIQIIHKRDAASI